MPATELTVQQMTPDGANITFVAANADGNFFINNGRTFLWVKNGSGAGITVTVAAPGPCDQTFTHPTNPVVPAGGERDIGSFLVARFSNASGNVDVTYSAVTSVTVAAVKL